MIHLAQNNRRKSESSQLEDPKFQIKGIFRTFIFEFTVFGFLKCVPLVKNSKVKKLIEIDSEDSAEIVLSHKETHAHTH